MIKLFALIAICYLMSSYHQNSKRQDKDRITLNNTYEKSIKNDSTPIEY